MIAWNGHKEHISQIRRSYSYFFSVFFYPFVAAKGVHAWISMPCLSHFIPVNLYDHSSHHLINQSMRDSRETYLVQ